VRGGLKDDFAERSHCATDAEKRRAAPRSGSSGWWQGASDVRRDPRVALHSPTIEGPQDDPEWPGDAKLAGTLIETAVGSFKIDIAEVVLTYVGTPADHLVIESWHPGRGWRRQTRA
jgi:hypothetical protein